MMWRITELLRKFMKIIVFLLLAVLSGCAYDAPSGLVCDTEGEASQGRVCRDGLWVKSDDPLLDMDAGGDTESDTETDTETDVEIDVPDMNEDADMCIPETPAETCSRAGANCGQLQAVNNCGETVSVVCGTCTAPLECGVGGSPNVCGCVGSDDSALCASVSANCGTINVVDPACGVARDVMCGSCQAPEVCGQDNVCACTPETDAQFCTRLQAECGSVTAPDNCGTMRTRTCGTCSGVEKCGFPTANQCGCDRATICSQLDLQCGMANINAQCPDIGTIDCGGCTNGTCNINTCECDAGYTTINGICQDINECLTNSGGCAMNATCANTPGSFTCTCNMGFTGDGFTCTPVSTPPSITQTVEGTTTGSSITTASMTNNQDQALFIAIVSIRTASRKVTGVTGLGLTWASVLRQCNRGGTEFVEVWAARGVASTGTVQITLNNDPYAAAATVLRVDGASTSPNAEFSSANANGITCGGGNTSSTYTRDVDQIGANRLLIAATSTLGVSHTPGAGWTAHSDVSRNGGGGNNTAHYVFTKLTAGTGDTAVNGTFNSNTHWANIVVNIPSP